MGVITHCNLLTAISDGDVKVLKEQILLGANINQKDDDGSTLLMTAAIFNNVDTVRCLVEYAHMPIDECDRRGWTALMVATSQGHLEVVKYLVSAGADLHTRSASGDTVLHVAALAESVETFSFLLQSGANVDVRNVQGRTPLHNAADFAYPDMVEFILQGEWLPVDCKDKFGQTPLMLTAGFPRTEQDPVRHGNWLDFKDDYLNKAMIMLLNAGADPSVKDILGRTALHAALINKRNFGYLLERSPEFVHLVDKKGQMPIMTGLILFNHYYEVPSTVKMLLDAGTDPNIEDENGKTALHYAAERHQHSAIKLLLNAGARTSCCGRETLTQILHCAMWNEDYELVKLMLKDGADINGRQKHIYTSDEREDDHRCMRNYDAVTFMFDDFLGESPIFEALRYKKMTSLLISAGADVNFKDIYYTTPLIAALRYGSYEVLEMLLDAGADPSAANICGVTLLHCVPERLKRRKEAKEMMKLCERVINFGVEVNAVDHDGRTPLHYAAVTVDWKRGPGVVSFFEMLVRAGAKVNATDINNQTPLHYASRKGNLEIIKLLIKNGADLLARDKTGRTALHQAAHIGDDSVITYLMKSYKLEWGCDNEGNNTLHCASNVSEKAHKCMRLILGQNLVSVDEKNAKGQTALLTVVQNIPYMKSSKKEVEMLLNERANPNTVDNEGKTALHYAVTSEDMKTVEFLISSGADVTVRDAKGQLPLHCAAKAGSVELLELLIQVGNQKALTVDERDSEGQTALMHAVNSRDAVSFLLREGADVSAKDHSGKTALQTAVDCGNFHSSKLLWATGGKFLSLPKASLIRAAHLVAAEDDIQMFEHLISLGLSLSDCWWDPEHNKTLLHSASKSNHQMLKYVTKIAKSTEEKDENGLTALLCAVNSSNVIGTKHLLQEAKAQVDARDQQGRTALMLVVGPTGSWKENTEIFHILLEAGADMNAQDNKGLTAYQIANQSRNFEYCVLLDYMKYYI